MSAPRKFPLFYPNLNKTHARDNWLIRLITIQVTREKYAIWCLFQVSNFTCFQDIRYTLAIFAKSKFNFKHKNTLLYKFKFKFPYP